MSIRGVANEKFESSAFFGRTSRGQELCADWFESLHGLSIVKPLTIDVFQKVITQFEN